MVVAVVVAVVVSDDDRITRAVLRLVWPSILLQSARDRVATAAETVTASRLWSVMSVNSVNNNINRFLNLFVSLGHHKKLTRCWHHGTRHTCTVS